MTMDRIRIKGANGDLLIDPSMSLQKKNGEISKSIGALDFPVRILMRGYVSVSCAGERESMWRHPQSAIRHITIVGASSGRLRVSPIGCIRELPTPR